MTWIIDNWPKKNQTPLFMIFVLLLLHFASGITKNFTVLFFLTHSHLILHTENSDYGLSLRDLIIPNFNRYLIHFTSVSTKSILKYLQCCDKYLIWLWMMNEYKAQLLLFSLLLRVVEILDVVELWDNSLRVSLSNQCWMVCTYLLGMSVARLMRVCMCMRERRSIDQWRRSSCQMWKLSSSSSIDLMSTYIQEEKLH